MYLVVVLDWYSRRVLAWRLSNTLTTDFCFEAVKEAIKHYSVPDTFNTDQGSQFMSEEFIGLLQTNGIRINMDGKGCWLDNVFVEQRWRTIKYEDVYLYADDSMNDVKTHLIAYLDF